MPFVLELLLYPVPGEGSGADSSIAGRAADVIASVRDFAAPEFGVDLFKLESPVPAELLAGLRGRAARVHAELFAELNDAAGRPWMLLSAGARKEDFAVALKFACRAGASGYLAGRAIWWDSLRAWPNRGKVRALLGGEAVPYMRRLNRLTGQGAMSWHEHPVYRNGGLPELHADLRRDQG